MVMLMVMVELMALVMAVYESMYIIGIIGALEWIFEHWW